jgi:uncharacterized membrane protein YjjB (DUF3815 family)
MNGLDLVLYFLLITGCGFSLYKTIKSESFKSRLKVVLVAMLAICIGILLIDLFFGIVRGNLQFLRTLQGPRG